MKYILSLFLLATAAASCDKDRTTCYECQMDYPNSTAYTDAGCFTKDDWDATNFSTPTGQPINKNDRCRKK